MARNRVAHEMMRLLGLAPRSKPAERPVPEYQQTERCFSRALSTLLAGRRMTQIVQVGANDGRFNDPIYESVMRYRDRTRVLLIEPLEEVIPFLRENYRTHPEARFLCAAISPTASPLVLYKLKPQYYPVFRRPGQADAPVYRVPTGFTSSVRDHVVKHAVQGLPPGVSPDRAIETVTVPTTTLKGALDSAGWGSCDVLQIDAEGTDDEVIYASSVKEVLPLLVNFEYRHLSDERIRSLDSHLCECGYVTVYYSRSNALAISTCVGG